jgi:hypothetical protein
MVDLRADELPRGPFEADAKALHSIRHQNIEVATRFTLAEEARARPL